MNRRKLLVTGGLGLGVGGGYLGWSWYHSPTVPDGMDVDTLYLERDIRTEDSSRSSDSVDWKEERHTVLEDADTAADELVRRDPVRECIENTDFSRSYLLLVQNGMQSEPDLVLDTIERTDDGIHLVISIDAPWFGTADDLVTHSLLTRITDEKDGVPGTVTLDIVGYV